MKNKIISIALSLIICIAMMPQFAATVHAESVPAYNASTAVSYAKANWNKLVTGETKADCIAFARACVEKGGVPKDSARVAANGTGYTVKQYIDYMVDNGYAELNKLSLKEVTFYNGKVVYYINANDNKGKVSVGDIFIYKCTNSACKKPYFHASICAPVDASEGELYDGYYRYYAHNSNVNNEVACAIECSSCGADESKMQMYALHIKSSANGFANYTDKVNVKVSRAAYNKLKISWNAVSGASKYNVFYKKKSDGFFTKLTTTTGTSVTHTISKDEYAGNFYYMVRPCKTIGGKEYVGKASATATNYTVAAKPANLKVKLYDYRSAKITWSKANGATGYKVEYKRSYDSKWSFLEWSADTSAKRPNLAAGTKYYFKITPYTTSKLYTGKRMSPNYTTYTLYTLKRLPAPSVSKATSKTVNVKWSNIDGESGYQIATSANKSKNFKIVKTVSSKYSSNKISAPKKKTYYYKVRAYKTVDGKKIYGPWSNVKSYKLK